MRRTEHTIIIAPDSFKGSLSSAQAADAIERGVRAAMPAGVQANIIKIPIADGGEGTVEAMLAAMGGSLRRVTVSGPLGDPADGFYGVLEDGTTAVIEMAAASGLTLVEEHKRDPLRASSYGTGELIAHAIRSGCTRLYIGAGGSATNDGGMGMAQALGAKFYNKEGQELGVGANQLNEVDRIDAEPLHKFVRGVSVIVISDVTNPLCGDQGATAVFGPQKGVTEETAPVLESGMRHYAERIRACLGIDVKDMPGAGAGGGIGAGLAAFLGAELRRGIEVVAEATGLSDHLRGAWLVITGEGRTDSQTAFGKVPAGIAAIARRHNVPVICLAGSITGDLSALHDLGVTACFSIVNQPMSLAEAMRDADLLLERKAGQVLRLFLAGMEH